MSSQDSPVVPDTPHPRTSTFSYAPSQYSESIPLKEHPTASNSPGTSPTYEPLDPLARKRWRWKLRNLSSSFWFWEASACILTLGIAGIIYYQLKKLDGNALDAWGYQWSPTSSLALAVTIAKASMMIPVASALGQLKWHWFRTFRRVDGMEHFDDASRGVLGSLRLLWRLKLWRLASIGALITVCALSIDALTQNAVRLTTEPNHTYWDSVSRTNVYNVTSRFSQRGRDFPPSSLLSTAYYAISTSTPPSFDQSLASCSSGNCTFGTYDSLAIDFECVRANVNRTDDLVEHSAEINPYFYLNMTDGIITSNTTTAIPDAGYFKNLGPLISRWLVLVNPSTVNPAPVAMDCAFYWTVKKYSSEVISGRFYEEVTATYTNMSSVPSMDDIYITPDECWRGNISIPTTNETCTNIVDRRSQASLRAWFNLSDFSLSGVGLNATKSDDSRLYWNYNSIFIQAIMSNLTNANESEIVAQVNLTAERLSTTLTTMIRQTPENIHSNGTSTYGESNGTTIWHPQTLYDIQWRYLIFPLILIIISTLFFATTVLFTWGEGGWKSSQLAVIFHGLTEDDSRAVGSVKSYADMRELGRELHVKLVDTQSGKKLASRDALLHI